MLKIAVFLHTLSLIARKWPKGTLIVTLHDLPYLFLDLVADFRDVLARVADHDRFASGVTKVLKGRFIHPAFKPQLKIQF